ncbi:MAG: leucine dehydrogenase [Candidatus Latescibacteria bacterium]|nr:leucine dehydrogenase [Candidatus Latescibacterota bacterium]NIM64750.1 leucine dehydrogenase [Candidatus Latescibacterota bacterium]NIO01260.1 leucine dehydrogenase [Candidatus Latescibacterota bacterium]NIO27645.1 leucine dehydrogenase [Candidatus Latescibacterota bacterium]NIO55177.1 leucine dehydrogenase [Candidatus Latescibacterota bacterium]
MGKAERMTNISPQEFVQFLKEQRITRFFFVHDKKNDRLICSHTQLQPMADFIGTDRRDFMQHEGLFFQVCEPHDTLQGAFVHRTLRGQASGGVRFWHYDTVEDYLRDGLRLSKAMTQKIALAGMWWGGGKGVIAKNPQIDTNDPAVRAKIYEDYGSFLTSLRGCYVVAEDVGTNVTDMASIYSKSRFTTCIPLSLGGSGNPSVLTARGVICGMEAGIEFIGGGTLEGKTVAVQGMGNVGGPLIRFLFDKKVKKVIASDIDPICIDRVKGQLPDKDLETHIVERGDNSILGVECDILSPCATGAILNPDTIPGMKAKIICGGANNQLEEDERDGRLLQDQGIVYVPDFLTNRMGIVNCANEQYGYVNNDPFIERHLTTDWEQSIHQTTLKVLRTAQETGETPAGIAVRIADELSMELHPIFGHRGRQIIESLVADRWHESRP